MSRELLLHEIPAGLNEKTNAKGGCETQPALLDGFHVVVGDRLQFLAA